MRKGVRLLALTLVGLALLARGGASAETAVHIFTMDDVPPTLSWGVSDSVPEQTTVTLTFAGDCTLGGETRLRKHRNSFATKIADKGMAYPFAQLQPLFATDDMTLVNLEGVLGDSTEGKVKKTFNFLGDSAYTAILTEGSVECVNLANNHAMDYGERAYQNMTELLNEADVGYISEDVLGILEKDGVRIGLTASLFTMPDQKQAKLEKQMALLRELGCDIIIHSMHGGTEYDKRASGNQKLMAQAAVEAGASLVVGHHPHVVQDVELLDGVPVIYSLGNNSFGGNFNPSDKDALLLRATFHFTEGKPAAMDWSLYPIAISGVKNGNDYQPVLLEGDEAQRVINRVAQASDLELLPYAQDEGAKQKTIFYQEVEHNGRID